MALAAAAALAAACGEEPGPPAAGPGDALRAEVVHVTDGDTVRVELASGREERVRYIGVDTPEPEAGECFSGEATAANERLVAGREVRLVLDAEERDRYGRLLAYVYAGDVFVNARLLREGFAEPIVVRPNDRFAERFAALARDARRERRGLWASCSS